MINFTGFMGSLKPHSDYVTICIKVIISKFPHYAALCLETRMYGDEPLDSQRHVWRNGPKYFNLMLS